ncbi:MAG: hypothetical protein HY656_04795 [Acidobacteria bacterium]|nr:hypothetical protein [Acidobacteriota bacterium]
MKKFLAGIVLTGLLLVGSSLLLATSVPSFCPMKCCSGPADCPHPACCARK